MFSQHKILIEPLLITWIGVNPSLKYLPNQSYLYAWFLSQKIRFCEKNTKEAAYKILVWPKLDICSTHDLGSLSLKLRFINRDSSE